MALRFRCLILDHDDTAVDSTRTVHYPAHLEAMRLLRPRRRPINLDGWFLKNFEPGLMGYLSGELGLSQEELRSEYRIWRRFTTAHTPSFFAGFLEALAEYRSRGGLIAVVSHSEADIIRGHYRSFTHRLPAGPDLVFGWDEDEGRRKPSPWPVQRVLESFGLSAGQALIVDDLKPGVLMSQACGVPVAAAGWAHRIPEIHRYMSEHCLVYLESVQEFRALILS